MVERYDKVDSKKLGIAMESAMRWKELYGQEAQTKVEATAIQESAAGASGIRRREAQERQQTEPSLASATRTRPKDHDNSL